ncbi:MAG: hypothetical protein V7K97_02515 [Nostoc sp.]|uniref:hypothetical protein n=1 Tax=Nostoc sp. TaxID=1180 RepID=UPI002FF953A4
MQPADPRLLEEVADLVYARLIQDLNFYARRDVYDYAPQDLQPSGGDRTQSCL